jgi:biopolymer transport protein ExbB
MKARRSILFWVALSLWLCQPGLVGAQSPEGSEGVNVESLTEESGQADENGPGDPSPSSSEGDSAQADAQAEDNAQAEAPAVDEEDSKTKFRNTSERIMAKLEAAQAELNQVAQRAKEVKLPLSRKITELEKRLSEAQTELQNVLSRKDKQSQDLMNLTNRIADREKQAKYILDLLNDYNANFKASLHPSERHLFEPVQAQAAKALESADMGRKDVYAAQGKLLRESMRRLDALLGGTRFEARAIAPDGRLEQGRVLLLGPVALFRSENGQAVGTVIEKAKSPTDGDSAVPAVVPFGQMEDRAAAEELVRTGQGRLPLDTTMGNAHKMEATKETILEHIQKGGVVMYPILGMAGLALLVVLFKWLSLVRIPKPSRKRVQALLRAVGRSDEQEARREVEKIKGPVGRMLQSGVDHIREPYELIEEVMYETVLGTRLKLQRLLPFVSIAAASAPLLGLLGTVTGIINTFKQITVHGSGDVKMLSGGISEALITTEFGLVVAIPSLLLHAFLSRKAKGMANDMEKTAVAFVNQVRKAEFGNEENSAVLEARIDKELHISEDDSDAPDAAPKAKGEPEGEGEAEGESETKKETDE